MRNLVILTLCVSMLGCSPSYVSDQHKVQIAEGVQFQLITSLPFDHGLQLVQSAQIDFQEQSHDLLFQTEVSHNCLIMVGLTPTGTRLFSIEMNQGQILASGLPSNNPLKPQHLLADLQLSLWPEQQIGMALSGADIHHTGPFERIISHNQQPIIVIRYSEPVYYQGNIEFRHLQRGYSLNIELLSIEEVSDGQ